MARTATPRALPRDCASGETGSVGSQQSISPPIFLTAPETANVLRISPVTLGRWRIEGKGPPFRKFGRRVLYATSDLIAWGEAQKRVSTSEAGTR
jgi:Helix-turn-helix domain